MNLRKVLQGCYCLGVRLKPGVHPEAANGRLCLARTLNTSRTQYFQKTEPRLRDINPIMQAKMDVSKLSKLEGWNELWKDNFTPWQQDQVNPKLAHNLETVIKACEKTEPESVRFFVPLCGKTPDLIYLYEKGYQVIGLEGVEKACQEFFEENKIEFKRTEDKGFVFFQNLDGRLKLVCGDFFVVTPDILGGQVDCIWDRGSFVAIDVAQRKMYAEVMSTLVTEKFGYLLVSIERETELENMMPHSVSFNDTVEHFGGYCTVKVLEQVLNPGQGDAGYIKDNAFLLHHKTVSEETERLNYWQSRWVSGDAQWHSQKPNIFLVKHLESLKAGREHVRIFLPLCGKSVDLEWLYNQGHTVVGLEGIPFVAEQVFQVAKLEYSKYYIPEIEGFIFKTTDERLTIYSCDLFKMTPQIIGKFEAIFDRGSFEAINEEDRAAYSEFILKILAPKFRIILNGYEYCNEVFKGPPRNVNREQVFKLFGSKTEEGVTATVSIAEEQDCTEDGKARFNLEKMTKLLYLIQNQE